MKPVYLFVVIWVSSLYAAQNHRIAMPSSQELSKRIATGDNRSVQDLVDNSFNLSFTRFDKEYHLSDHLAQYPLMRAADVVDIVCDLLWVYAYDRPEVVAWANQHQISQPEAASAIATAEFPYVCRILLPEHWMVLMHLHADE